MYSTFVTVIICNPPKYIGYRVSASSWLQIRPFHRSQVSSLKRSCYPQPVRRDCQTGAKLNEWDEDLSRPTLPADMPYPDPDVIHNGTFRNDDFPTRRRIIEILTEKLLKYSKTLYFIIHSYDLRLRRPMSLVMIL